MLRTLVCTNPDCSHTVAVNVPIRTFTFEYAETCCPECGFVRVNNVDFDKMNLLEGIHKLGLLGITGDRGADQKAAQDARNYDRYMTKVGRNRIMGDRFKRRNAQLDEMERKDPRSKDFFNHLKAHYGVKAN